MSFHDVEGRCRHCGIDLTEWDHGWMDADADGDDPAGLRCESNPDGHDPATCAWFALCDNPATTTVPHPILGPVDACERCEALANA